MGYYLINIAIKISRSNEDFKIWDKGQMMLILSCTKLAKNNISVGYKNNTLLSLKDLLTRKTQ